MSRNWETTEIEPEDNEKTEKSVENNFPDSISDISHNDEEYFDMEPLLIESGSDDGLVGEYVERRMTEEIANMPNLSDNMATKVKIENIEKTEECVRSTEENSDALTANIFEKDNEIHHLMIPFPETKPICQIQNCKTIALKTWTCGSIGEECVSPETQTLEDTTETSVQQSGGMQGIKGQVIEMRVADDSNRKETPDILKHCRPCSIPLRRFSDDVLNKLKAIDFSRTKKMKRLQWEGFDGRASKQRKDKQKKTRGKHESRNENYQQGKSSGSASIKDGGESKSVSGLKIKPKLSKALTVKNSDELKINHSLENTRKWMLNDTSSGKDEGITHEGSNRFHENDADSEKNYNKRDSRKKIEKLSTSKSEQRVETTGSDLDRCEAYTENVTGKTSQTESSRYTEYVKNIISEFCSTIPPQNKNLQEQGGTGKSSEPRFSEKQKRSRTYESEQTTKLRSFETANKSKHRTCENSRRRRSAESNNDDSETEIILSRKKIRRIISSSNTECFENDKAFDSIQKRKRKNKLTETVREVEMKETTIESKKELRVVLFRLEDMILPPYTNKNAKKSISPLDNYIKRGKKIDTNCAELPNHKVSGGKKISSNSRHIPSAPSNTLLRYFTKNEKDTSETDRPAESVNQNNGKEIEQDRDTLLRTKHGIVKDVVITLVRLESFTSSRYEEYSASEIEYLSNKYIDFVMNSYFTRKALHVPCSRVSLSSFHSKKKIFLESNAPQSELSEESSSSYSRDVLEIRDTSLINRLPTIDSEMCDENMQAGFQDKNILTQGNQSSESLCKNETSLGDSTKQFSSSSKKYYLSAETAETSFTDRKEESYCRTRNISAPIDHSSNLPLDDKETLGDSKELNLPLQKDYSPSRRTEIPSKRIGSLSSGSSTTDETTNLSNDSDSEIDYMAIDQELREIIEIYDTSSSNEALNEVNNLSPKKDNSPTENRNSANYSSGLRESLEDSPEELNVPETDRLSPQTTEMSSRGDRALNSDKFTNKFKKFAKKFFNEVASNKLDSIPDSNSAPPPLGFSFTDAEVQTDPSKNSSPDTVQSSELDSLGMLILDRGNMLKDSLIETRTPSKQDKSSIESNQNAVGRRLLEESCDVCNAGFKDEQQRQMHNESMHSHNCIICKKLFSFRESLKQHLLTQICGTRKFCSICHKTFSANEFVNHCLNHSDANDINVETNTDYVCLICNKKFTYKLNLMQHLRKKHRQHFRKVDLKKRIQLFNRNNRCNCSVCPLIFNSKESLFTHLITHTPIELQAAFKAAKAKQKVAIDARDGDSERIEESTEKSGEGGKTKKLKKIAPKGAHGPKEARKSRAEQVPAEEQRQVEGNFESHEAKGKEQEKRISVQEKEKSDTHPKQVAGQSVTICGCHSNEKILDHTRMKIEVTLLCISCQTLFRTKQCFNRHYLSTSSCRELNKKSAVMFCNKCNSIMVSLPEMRLHLEGHVKQDPQSTVTFACNICKIVFLGIGSLFYAHWFGHAQNAFYMAGPNTFPRNSVLISTQIEHMNEVAYEDYVFISEYLCFMCKKPFGTAAELVEHLKKLPQTPCVKPVSESIAIENPIQIVKTICSICKEEFVDRTKFEQHLEEHKSVKVPPPTSVRQPPSTGQYEFICRVCKTSHATKKDFENHTMQHSMLREKFVCNLCSLALDNMDDFRLHWFTHENVSKNKIGCKVIFIEVQFCCKRCKLGFDCQATLDEHISTHEPTDEVPLEGNELGNPNPKIVECIDGPTLVCPMCHQGFSCQIELDEHASSHGDPVFTGQNAVELEGLPNSMENLDCPVCSVSFDNIVNLEQHKLSHSQPSAEENAIVSTIGSEEETRECSSKDSKGEEPVPKPVSPKKFLRVRSLTELQEKRPYACTHCNTKFDTEMKLEEHSCSHRDTAITDDQSKTKNYSCEVCKDFQCETDYELKTHMASHSAVPSNQPSELIRYFQYQLPQSQRRIFVCNLCPDFECESESALRQHLIVHPAVFICRICSRFICETEYGIRRHEASHFPQAVFMPHANASNDTLQPLNDPDNSHTPLHPVQSVNDCLAPYQQSTLRGLLLSGFPSYPLPPAYRCQICKNFECITEQQLKAHEAQHLQSNTYVVCKYCPNRLFSCNTQLQEHEALYHNKVPTSNTYFACKQCSNVFISEVQMKQHEASIHASSNMYQQSRGADSQVNTYLCKSCMVNFAYAGDLLEHEKTYHSHSTYDTPTPQNASKCNICGLIIGSELGLNYHKRSHAVNFLQNLLQQNK